MLNKLRLRLRALFFKSQMEDELQAELQFHLEREIEENIIRGMSPEEARYAAIRSFGGVERVKEESRDVRGISLLEEVWQDLRYGARMLAKNPGFTTIAVLTLALGIGANTAIFSVVDAVIWRPLPFTQPDRLTAIWGEAPGGQTVPSMSVEAWQEWRNQKQLFEQVEAHTTRTFVLTGGAEPAQVVTELVSTGLFQMLGAQPRQGRPFLESDAEPGADHVVIISDGLWQSYFGGDANIVGKTVKLNDQPWTVIGVMAPRFAFPRPRFQFWAPLSSNPRTEAERRNRVEVVARLRAGLTLLAAQAEVKAVVQRLNQEKPIRAGWGAGLRRLDEHRVNPEPRRAMLLLFGAVGFVLLIACANAANLLLTRAASRGKEIAIRAALGAWHLRLMRQLLVESLLLALLGGAGGVLLALWGVDAIVRLAPAELTFLTINDISVSGRVLAFTLALSLVTGVICGLAPALRVSRPDLSQALKGLTRGAASRQDDRRRRWLRQALVVAEVSLSVVLLIGAGLMIRSFLRLNNVSPGFEARNLLALSLLLPRQRYPTIESQRNFFNQLKDRVAALPGVESVTLSEGIPPKGASFSFGLEVEVEGRGMEKLDSRYFLPFNTVDADYFRVMRIPLFRGRSFNEQDIPETPPVIIVNDEMARHYWPGEDPVGRRIRLFRSEPWLTVVGVVGDVKAFGLDDAHGTMEFYYPASQGKSMGSATLAIRAATEPGGMVEAVRKELWSLDKNQPITSINTAEQLLVESLSEPRFYLLLMAIFAASAILLAAIGLYGVVSYSVAERTQEIGVRMALGARSGDVLRLIVGQGLITTLTGVTIGLAAALALTRLMATLLYEIRATDPLTFILLPALLTSVALLACYFPARRATKVDPMIALRSE
jgi:predicted permease